VETLAEERVEEWTDGSRSEEVTTGATRAQSTWETTYADAEIMGMVIGTLL